MDFYSVLGKSPKSLDDNILFDPFEENLYIPAMSVEIGYLQGTDLKVVGYSMLPRKSSNVCIFTAPLLYLPNAHAASFMLVDMVVESKAYMTLSMVISDSLAFEYMALFNLMR